MNPTLWVSIALGLGGALGGLFTLFTKIQDRKADKQKKTGEIKLDQQEYERIAADAARINSTERIETERWWKEEFDAVKLELEEQHEWRRKMTKKLRAHRAWDADVAIKLKKHGETVDDPPSLDPDDEE